MAPFHCDLKAFLLSSRAKRGDLLLAKAQGKSRFLVAALLGMTRFQEYFNKLLNPKPKPYGVTT
jgi:hypothetical protein